MEAISEIDYGKYSTTELLDLYSRVDKIFNEDRFLAIEAELFKRTGMDREAIENELKKNMNSPVLGTEKKNNHFIVISWILIIYSGFTLLSTGVGLLSFLTFDFSFFKNFQDQSISPISEFLISHMYLIQIPSIIIAGLFIYYTIGLFKYRESSRENIVYLLWFALVWNFVAGIFTHEFITLPMMNATFQNFDFPVVNFFNSTSYVSIIVGELFPTIVIGYFIYKLSSREVKLLCEQ